MRTEFPLMCEFLLAAETRSHDCDSLIDTCATELSSVSRSGVSIPHVTDEVLALTLLQEILRHFILSRSNPSDSVSDHRFCGHLDSLVFLYPRND